MGRKKAKGIGGCLLGETKAKDGFGDLGEPIGADNNNEADNGIGDGFLAAGKLFWITATGH